MTPPDERVTRPAALRAALLREARRTEGGLRGVALLGRDDTEALHDLHRDLRFLRVATGLWPASRHPAPVPTGGESDRRLQRLARVVGEVRDRDVAIRLVLRHRTRLARPVIADRVRRRLEEESRIGRELLRRLTRTEMRAKLVATGVKAAAVSPTPSPRDLERRTLEQRRALSERLRRAVRQVRRKPTTRRLHRLRIALRNLRGLRVLSGRILGERDTSNPPPLSEFQAELGRLHDWDLLAERLRQLPHAPGLETWSGEVRARRRARRRRILTELRGGPIRRALAELTESR